jgi:hypothetical protein
MARPPEEVPFSPKADVCRYAEVRMHKMMEMINTILTIS